MARRLFLIVTAFLLAAAPGSHAEVVISEILASNEGGLHDLNSNSPDWIELHNTGAVPVNLAGWRLTDSAANLSKWIFPSTNMAPGSFLVVFASGVSVTSGPELHAGFQLEQNGGYIALVRPEGSIAHALTYGSQRANVSYGIGTLETTSILVASNAIARWLVPTNSSVEGLWKSVGFDDAGWNSAAMPLRYDVTIGGGPALSIDINTRSGDTPANTQAGFNSFTMTSASGIQTTASTRSYGSISVTISNSSLSVGYDDRLRTLPSNGGSFSGQNLLRDFIFSRESSGTSGLDIHVTGLTANQDYDLTIWSYDNSSGGNRVSDWFVNGVLATNNYAFNGSVLPTTDSQYRFTLRGRANSLGTIVISGRRDIASLDTANAASFGVFLNALQVTPLTAATVTNGNVAAMAAQNPAIYARIPFTVADPAAFDSIKLRLRYDDGFVAYLNGTEIARRNAPEEIAYNSTASATTSSPIWEDIILPGAAALLAGGNNVLAIEGLNVAAGDIDFLTQAELVAVHTVIIGERYFAPPTPGAENDPGYIGLVGDTKFSVDRGFFDAPFSLSITCATAGAEIRYTTNGSLPSPSNGAVLTVPITINGQSFIRAAAFLPGHVSSDVDTHSYVFLRDVLQQSNALPGYPTVWQGSYPADYAVDPAIIGHPVYGLTISNDLRSIPTLSIVTDQNGLWNSSTGIYPNATSIGPAWEREASLELISGSGKTEFAASSEIQMHGNASRDNARTPKHSIGVSFKADYGPAKLRYDWFGGGVTAHDKIVLRSCGFVDGWAGRYADNSLYTSAETGEAFRGLRYRPENTCYLRDVWVKDAFRDMGWLSSRTAFVHLYLNGLYWGLYEPSEHLDASYFSAHLGGNEGAWDVIVGEDNNGPPVIVDGTVDDWQAVLNLVNAGVGSESAYQAISSLVDIDNLIDYMLLHIFVESEDWPRHNWYLAHRRASNGAPSTKFIVSVWDQELTLDRLVRRPRVDVGTTGGEIYSPARVYNQLRSWPEFRRQFGDRVQKHLFNGGALTPSNCVARLLAPAAIIRDAIVGESARWGDARKMSLGGSTGTGQTFTRDEWWQPEIDKLATNFLLSLAADNVARLRAASLYPNVGAPFFNQFGGGVTNGFNVLITHTNGSGVIFYTIDGTDPRQYGSGAVSATAQAWSAPFSLLSATQIRARVLSGGQWSAIVEAVFYPPQDLSALRLTEIMYNPPAIGNTSGDEFEFVELKNSGTNALNLSGIQFSDGIAFTFTNGSMLSAGAFAVLTRNAVAFAGKYPGAPIYGIYSGKLDNGGELLKLTDPTGAKIFAITYGDTAPWPIAPDNFGYSLVPADSAFTQAADEGSQWRASSFLGGSPGSDDPASVIAPIVINEILTHTDVPAVDRIELFNPAATNVEIGGWFLTDDPTAPKKFRIPAGTTIGASGYVVFDEAQFNTTPGANGSFSLSSRGEQIYLCSGDSQTNLTGYSHGLSFGAAANGVSFGRYINTAGEEQFPAQIANSFGATNSGPRVGPVVINEIHYHPAAPLNSSFAFIELKNNTSAAIQLYDPAAPTNTWRISGLNFRFPTNTSIPPNGFALVIATNATAFRARYSVPAEAIIGGQFVGALQGSGERLTLERPDTPDTNGAPYIAVDSARYNDKSPWPPAADGSGPSLQRLGATSYGDDPINWNAAIPTPGAENSGPDSDGDGMPDLWELANGTNPGTADAFDDPDGDGYTNGQEYVAGTDPHNSSSRLAFSGMTLTANALQLQFNAASNRSYTISYKDSLSMPGWTDVTNIAPSSTIRSINFSIGSTNGSRYYRLSIP